MPFIPFAQYIFAINETYGERKTGEYIFPGIYGTMEWEVKLSFLTLHDVDDRF